MPIFNGFLPKKGHLEFSGAFFLAEIFENVSFDPYNFGSLEFQLGNPNRSKIFRGQKYANIYRLNPKIHSTMLCLSGFELYSRWVPLKGQTKPFLENVKSRRL